MSLNSSKVCPVISSKGNQVNCLTDECAWFDNDHCISFSILDKLDGIERNASTISSNTDNIMSYETQTDTQEILKVLQKINDKQ